VGGLRFGGWRERGFIGVHVTKFFTVEPVTLLAIVKRGQERSEKTSQKVYRPRSPHKVQGGHFIPT